MNDTLKDKVSEEDRTKILGLVDQTQKWLDDNQNATKEEYESKQKEVEKEAIPIMTKAYQSANPQGGSGGMPQGFDPNMFNNMGGPSGTNGSNPTVEEVD